MSEQAKILAQMQELIMEILKTGVASVEQGDALDTLEEELFKQKCFQATKSSEHSCQGEQIAALFFDAKREEAIKKMHELNITPEDFFGFAEYHFEDEEQTQMFTQSFKEETTKLYNSNSL